MNFRYLQKLSAFKKYKKLYRDARISSQVHKFFSAVRGPEDSNCSSCVPKSFQSKYLVDSQPSEPCFSIRNDNHTSTAPHLSRPVARKLSSVNRNFSKPTRSFKGNMRNARGFKIKSKKLFGRNETKKIDRASYTTCDVRRKPTKKYRGNKYTEEIKLKRILSEILRTSRMKYNIDEGSQRGYGLIIPGPNVDCIIRQNIRDDKEVADNYQKATISNASKTLLTVSETLNLQQRYYSTKGSKTIIGPSKKRSRSPSVTVTKSQKLPDSAKNPNEPVVANKYCPEPPCINEAQGLPYFYRQIKTKNNDVVKDEIQRVYFQYPAKIVKVEKPKASSNYAAPKQVEKARTPINKNHSKPPKFKFSNDGLQVEHIKEVITKSCTKISEEDYLAAISTPLQIQQEEEYYRKILSNKENIRADDENHVTIEYKKRISQTSVNKDIKLPEKTVKLATKTDEKKYEETLTPKEEKKHEEIIVIKPPSKNSKNKENETVLATIKNKEIKTEMPAIISFMEENAEFNYNSIECELKYCEKISKELEKKFNLEHTIVNDELEEKIKSKNRKSDIDKSDIGLVLQQFETKQDLGTKHPCETSLFNVNRKLPSPSNMIQNNDTPVNNSISTMEKLKLQKVCNEINYEPPRSSCLNPSPPSPCPSSKCKKKPKCCSSTETTKSVNCNMQNFGFPEAIKDTTNDNYKPEYYEFTPEYKTEMTNSLHFEEFYPWTSCDKSKLPSPSNIIQNNDTSVNNSISTMEKLKLQKDTKNSFSDIKNLQEKNKFPFDDVCDEINYETPRSNYVNPSPSFPCPSTKCKKKKKNDPCKKKPKCCSSTETTKSVTCNMQNLGFPEAIKDTTYDNYIPEYYEFTPEYKTEMTNSLHFEECYPWKSSDKNQKSLTTQNVVNANTESHQLTEYEDMDKKYKAIEKNIKLFQGSASQKQFEEAFSNTFIDKKLVDKTNEALDKLEIFEKYAMKKKENLSFDKRSVKSDAILNISNVGDTLPLENLKTYKLPLKLNAIKDVKETKLLSQVKDCPKAIKANTNISVTNTEENLSRKNDSNKSPTSFSLKTNANKNEMKKVAPFSQVNSFSKNNENMKTEIEPLKVVNITIPIPSVENPTLEICFSKLKSNMDKILRFEEYKKQLLELESKKPVKFIGTLTLSLNPLKWAQMNQKVSNELSKTEKICKEELLALQSTKILNQDSASDKVIKVSQEDSKKANFSKPEDLSTKKSDNPKKFLTVLDKIWSHVELHAKKTVKEMEKSKTSAKQTNYRIFADAQLISITDLQSKPVKHLEENFKHSTKDLLEAKKAELKSMSEKKVCDLLSDPEIKTNVISQFRKKSLQKSTASPCPSHEFISRHLRNTTSLETLKVQKSASFSSCGGNNDKCSKYKRTEQDPFGRCKPDPYKKKQKKQCSTPQPLDLRFNMKASECDECSPPCIETKNVCQPTPCIKDVCAMINYEAQPRPVRPNSCPPPPCPTPKCKKKKKLSRCKKPSSCCPKPGPCKKKSCSRKPRSCKPEPCKKMSTLSCSNQQTNQISSSNNTRIVTCAPKIVAVKERIKHCRGNYFERKKSTCPKKSVCDPCEKLRKRDKNLVESIKARYSPKNKKRSHPYKKKSSLCKKKKIPVPCKCEPSKKPSEAKFLKKDATCKGPNTKSKVQGAPVNPCILPKNKAKELEEKTSKSSCCQKSGPCKTSGTANPCKTSGTANPCKTLGTANPCKKSETPNPFKNSRSASTYGKSREIRPCGKSRSASSCGKSKSSSTCGKSKPASPCRKSKGNSPCKKSKPPSSCGKSKDRSPCKRSRPPSSCGKSKDRSLCKRSRPPSSCGKSKDRSPCKRSRPPSSCGKSKDRSPCKRSRPPSSCGKSKDRSPCKISRPPSSCGKSKGRSPCKRSRPPSSCGKSKTQSRCRGSKSPCKRSRQASPCGKSGSKTSICKSSASKSSCNKSKRPIFAAYKPAPKNKNSVCCPRLTKPWLINKLPCKPENIFTEKSKTGKLPSPQCTSGKKTSGVCYCGRRSKDKQEQLIASGNVLSCSQIVINRPINLEEKCDPKTGEKIKKKEKKSGLVLPPPTKCKKMPDIKASSPMKTKPKCKIEPVKKDPCSSTSKSFSTNSLSKYDCNYETKPDPKCENEKCFKYKPVEISSEYDPNLCQPFPILDILSCPPQPKMTVPDLQPTLQRLNKCKSNSKVYNPDDIHRCETHFKPPKICKLHKFQFKILGPRLVKNNFTKVYHENDKCTGKKEISCNDCTKCHNSIHRKVSREYIKKVEDMIQRKQCYAQLSVKTYPNIPPKVKPKKPKYLNISTKLQDKPNTSDGFILHRKRGDSVNSDCCNRGGKFSA